MFNKGQAVKCIDAKMECIGDGLTKGKVYHVEEYLSPEECKKLLPNDPARWEKEAGRVEVKEHPGCHWYGRRFGLRAESQDN